MTLLAMLTGCTVVGDVKEVPLEGRHTAEVYAHPELPAEPTVVVVLDGDWYAHRARRTVDRLVEDGFEAPLLVTVGYADGNDRNLDFTPTDTEAFGDGGGLAAFGGFLEDELLPLVEADGAGGSPDRRVLFGHSLGGLAVTNLWLTRPDLANRVLAVSPSLWWDEGHTFDVLEEADPEGEIVVTVGAMETLGMAALAAAFADRLEGEPAVDVHFEALAGKDHSSVVTPSLDRGLRALLEEG